MDVGCFSFIFQFSFFLFSLAICHTLSEKSQKKTKKSISIIQTKVFCRLFILFFLFVLICPSFCGAAVLDLSDVDHLFL
jgi:hypothetical protein